MLLCLLSLVSVFVAVRFGLHLVFCCYWWCLLCLQVLDLCLLQVADVGSLMTFNDVVFIAR